MRAWVGGGKHILICASPFLKEFCMARHRLYLNPTTRGTPRVVGFRGSPRDRGVLFGSNMLTVSFLQNKKLSRARSKIISTSAILSFSLAHCKQGLRERHSDGMKTSFRAAPHLLTVSFL